MLRSLGAIRGFEVRATDGRIGAVRDLCFDRVSWQIAQIVVATRAFLGSELFIDPEAIARIDPRRKTLKVALSRHHAEVGAPARGTGTPESRELHDPNLYRTRELAGYRLQAADGNIGHIEDFVFDDQGWVIRYLVVSGGQWLRTTALVAPTSALEIAWNEQRGSIRSVFAP
jgi:uncharacterized protein YrrD